MNSLDTQFHRRLAKRLDDEIQNETRTLASGLLDHLDYKRVCGRLNALQDVAEMCAAIESDINQGK